MTYFYHSILQAYVVRIENITQGPDAFEESSAEGVLGVAGIGRLTAPHLAYFHTPCAFVNMINTVFGASFNTVTSIPENVQRLKTEGCICKQAGPEL